MYRISLAALLALLFAACAPKTMETLDASKRTKTFSASQGAVFQATIDALNSEKVPITSADRERGRIETDFKDNEMLSKFIVGNIRAKFTIDLKSAGEGSTTMVALIVMEKRLDWPLSGWRAVESDEAELEQWYNDFFDAVEERLARM